MVQKPDLVEDFVRVCALKHTVIILTLPSAQHRGSAYANSRVLPVLVLHSKLSGLKRKSSLAVFD